MAPLPGVALACGRPRYVRHRSFGRAVRL